MKKFKLIMATLLVALILTGCQSKTPELKYVTESGSFRVNNDGAIPLSEEPELINVSDSGSFKVDKDGAVSSKEKSVAPVTIDLFFEPMCGACRLHESVTKTAMQKQLKAGNIEIIYHPVIFLNDYLEGNSKDYSWNAAAYTLAVAEYEPTKVRDFIGKLMLESSQTEAGSNPDFNQETFFATLFNDLEISEEIQKIMKDNLNTFKKLAVVSTDEFIGEKSKWIQFTNEEDEEGPYVYTPFVLVNPTGTRSNLAQNFHDEGKLVDELNEAIAEAMGTNDSLTEIGKDAAGKIN